MEKRFVIGIEAGFSGGKELCDIINMMAYSQVYYNMSWKDTIHKSGVLPWKFDKNRAKRKINAFNCIAEKQIKLKKSELPDSINNLPIIVGDFGHYYVNYIEYFILHVPNLKLIATHHDKDDVIKTMVDKFNADFFLKNDNIIHKSYPNINHLSDFKEIVSYYYDFYSNVIDAFVTYYPKKILVLNYKELYKTNPMRKLYNFLHNTI